MSRKSAAAASTALSIAEFIDNYPGMPEGARAAMLLLKLYIVSFLHYAWREVHNKMLLRHSIALDCLERTLPPIDEDQKLALLHAPFKGTTLFGGELAKLQEANMKRAATFTGYFCPTALGSSASGPPGHDRHGQFNSSFTYQQAGRDSLPHPAALNCRSFPLVRVSEHSSPGKTYSRLSERDTSRPPISSESANTDRVVPAPRDRESYLQGGQCTCFPHSPCSTRSCRN